MRLLPVYFPHDLSASQGRLSIPIAGLWKSTGSNLRKFLRRSVSLFYKPMSISAWKRNAAQVYYTGYVIQVWVRIDISVDHKKTYQNWSVRRNRNPARMKKMNFDRRLTDEIYTSDTVRLGKLVRFTLWRFKKQRRDILLWSTKSDTVNRLIPKV